MLALWLPFCLQFCAGNQLHLPLLWVVLRIFALSLGTQATPSRYYSVLSSWGTLNVSRRREAGYLATFLSSIGLPVEIFPNDDLMVLASAAGAGVGHVQQHRGRQRRQLQATSS